MKPFLCASRSSSRRTAATNSAGRSTCGTCAARGIVATTTSGRDRPDVAKRRDRDDRSRQPQITPSGASTRPSSDRRSARSTAATAAPIRVEPLEARSIMRASSADSRCGSAIAPHRRARRAVELRAIGAPTRRRILTAGSLSAPAAAATGEDRGAKPAGAASTRRRTRSGRRTASSSATAPPKEFPSKSNGSPRALAPAGPRAPRRRCRDRTPRPRGARLAEAREIRGDHVVILGQRGRHAAPDGTVRADPVQEHERPAVPGLVDRNHGGDSTLHR